MCHWCHEETYAVMSLLWFLPFFGLWFRTKLNAWRKRVHDKKGCDHDHQ